MGDYASWKGYKAIVNSYEIVSIGPCSLVSNGGENMILKNAILSQPNNLERCSYQRKH